MQKKQQSEAKFITPKQLTERWGDAINIGTLANWRSQGKGPPYLKLGTHVVYPIDALLEWEQQNMVGSTKQD